MEQQIIETLKQAIEQAVGRKIKTPKDFDFLTDCIFNKVHERISPTTLKRLWGYLTDAGSAPRKSTLDILSRFLDYPDWAAFCASHSTSEAASPSSPTPPQDLGSSTPGEPLTEQTDSPSSNQRTPFHHGKGWRWVVPLLILFLVGLCLIFSKSLGIGGFSEDKPILRQGQTFATYDDYLSIFGLKSDADHNFFIRLPDYEYTVLWAPRYKHPNWHNEGDSAALMPTITEYYHPADYPTDSASLAELAKINKERYINAIRIDEVRLIFMKNLVDTNFVFLGVYRLSTSLSDSSHVVWRRVRTDFDPNHLEVLKTYRY